MTKGKALNSCTIVLAVVVLAACAAHADYTVTTNDGVVAFFNDTDSRITITDSYLAEDGIESLTFNSTSGYFSFSPSVPSTYAGGTTISRGQLFVNRSDAFGTGPITIKDSSSLMINGYNLAFDNKIVFNQEYSYVVGYNGGSVTLRSVGTEGSAHRIRIGRTGAGAASRATLSLTGADSEAIGRIYTSGNLDLTLDGGTIAARSDAESPFFKSFTSEDTSSAAIAPAGVTFDVAEGADIELGLSPAFRRDTVTNVVDTVAGHRDLKAVLLQCEYDALLLLRLNTAKDRILTYRFLDRVVIRESRRVNIAVRVRDTDLMGDF